jgi:hypothetical protein
MPNASYRLSYSNALAEVHTLAETLIKPCVVEMVICVLG